MALFDIDGTVFRWQLFFSVVFVLKDWGAFDEATTSSIDDNFRAWQARELAWDTLKNIVVYALLDNITSIDVAMYKKACDHVMETEGHKVYAYTTQLIEELKDQGYDIIAITGSSQTIAQPFADRYGFTRCIGEKYLEKDGKFTGEVEYVFDRKDKIIHDLVEKEGYTFEGSVAIGDSGSDIVMLELAERAIAFNPDSKLLETSLERGWEVVVERKNIAYHLTKDDHGHIVLAQADSL